MSTNGPRGPDWLLQKFMEEVENAEEPTDVHEEQVASFFVEAEEVQSLIKCCSDPSGAR